VTNRLSANSTTPLLKPAVNISLTFDIGATYCFPKGDTKKTSTVQLLTHGLGFDRNYWNLSAPADSYVASAAASGYATLAYDRLGCGISSRPDPYNIIQAPVELAVLATLTQLLRSGKLSPQIPVPVKVIHVGHSYGSQLSNALASAQPKLSDGLVLTGYSLDSTYQPWFLQSTGFHLAKDIIPGRFANASTGFVTWGDKVANQFAFLTYPYFDPVVLDRAECGKMPITIGELLTLKLISPLSPKFTGPVMVRPSLA
jgi:pimeloyl-ACP methyl ester carboxylesterase